jgi:hypothetical protein
MEGGVGVSGLNHLSAEGGTVSGPAPLAREAKFFRLQLHFCWRRTPESGGRIQSSKMHFQPRSQPFCYRYFKILAES